MLTEYFEQFIYIYVYLRYEPSGDRIGVREERTIATHFVESNMVDLEVGAAEVQVIAAPGALLAIPVVAIEINGSRSNGKI